MTRDERIALIESLTRNVDGLIYALQRFRDELCTIDEEYASYVEHYRAYYEDDPLPIRQYYAYMDELSAIGAEFSKPNVDYEQIWQQHKHRIIELERALAA